MLDALLFNQPRPPPSDLADETTGVSLPPMKPSICTAILAVATTFSALAEGPKLPGVGAMMQEMITKNEIAGAITVVVTEDKTVHMETTGLADVATKRPMTPDTLFWIASMTKPVTGAAILMLQDEGKLNVADPVAKYLPEFANLKTPSGKPANLTISQILTHTSGLGEAGGDGNTNAVRQAKTLADLVPLWLAAPMQYEPGATWQYCQSGINAAGRIVEVVSGMTFDAFLQKRLFVEVHGRNARTHRSFIANVSHQCPCVDVFDADDVVVL